MNDDACVAFAEPFAKGHIDCEALAPGGGSSSSAVAGRCGCDSRIRAPGCARQREGGRAIGHALRLEARRTGGLRVDGRAKLADDVGFDAAGRATRGRALAVARVGADALAAGGAGVCALRAAEALALVRVECAGAHCPAVAIALGQARGVAGGACLGRTVRAAVDPHAVRQLPVAAAPHVVSAVPPMSAWHCVAVSICAQVKGHSSFAVRTQFWSTLESAATSLPGRWSAGGNRAAHQDKDAKRCKGRHRSRGTLLGMNHHYCDLSQCLPARRAVGLA